MELAINIFNISMICASLWIVHKFLGNFLNKKKFNAYIAMAWLSYACLQFIIEGTLRGEASIVITCLSFIVVLWISAVGYEKAGKKKLFYVIILHVIWAIIEMLVYFMAFHLPIDSIRFEVLGSVISKILMILVVQILTFYTDRYEEGEIASIYYFPVLFVPLGSIYIAIDKFFANEFDVASFIVFGILLLINIIIFDVYIKLAENLKLEKEKLAYERQIDIMNRSMEEQKKIMNDFYEEKHNFINQLIAVKDVAEHGEQGKVVADLNAMVNAYGKSEEISRSGNSTVDAILNSKYAVAKERGIKFTPKILIPMDLPVHECDLGIVLGNALDNAIEATQACEHHEKCICISMGIKRDDLVMTIKNPYEHLIKKNKSGKLLSSKNDKRRHGYGINSIKKVAERYEGDVFTEADDGKFTLTVLMALREI